MENRILTDEMVQNFVTHLREKGRAEGTIEDYLRAIRLFQVYLEGRGVTQEEVNEFKEYMRGKGMCPVTVNAKLSGLNGLFAFLGWEDYHATFYRIQRMMFREDEKELLEEEYYRLCEAALDRNDERMALLVETIGSSGVRVSEVQFITVEAVRRGRAQIQMKGKFRTILLTDTLIQKLLDYIKRKGIVSGPIFITRRGKPMSRRQIWASMKALCKDANVKPSKVFPHNLRHFFAQSYYKAYKDIARLADMLGHANIETTRIYLRTTAAECVRQLNEMGLVR